MKYFYGKTEEKVKDKTTSHKLNMKWIYTKYESIKIRKKISEKNIIILLKLKKFFINWQHNTTQQTNKQQQQQQQKGKNKNLSWSNWKSSK